jgi:hypothetical protein
LENLEDYQDRRTIMKITKAPRPAVFILAMLSLMATSAYASTADETSKGGLSVDIRANKQDYVLGETVRLTIRVTNVSGQTIEIPELPSMRNGMVSLFVSDKERFREYEWPGAHADVDGAEVQIAPGRAIETEATILYLNRRETKHLSEPYARDIREKYLDTDYAFMKAGTYRIKALVLAGEAEAESQPVTIRIHEPKGADLQVWNVLQANPDLGYFVQLGIPKAYLSTVDRAALAKALSDLTVAYPDSRQANDIRLSLARYKDTLQALSRSQQEQ